MQPSPHLHITLEVPVRSASGIPLSPKELTLSPHLITKLSLHGGPDATLVCCATLAAERSISMLLRHSAHLSALQEALQRAVYQGQVDTARQVLDAGADVHDMNDAPLRLAVYRGDVAMAAMLLDRGANLHAQDEEALRTASVKGYLPLVQLLLDHGADLAVKQQTPLRKAAYKGHAAVVHLLLAHGADPNTGEENKSSLCYAAHSGSVETVRLLLEHGAKASGGALVVAAKQGYAEVARVLLQHGADPGQQSRDSGKTALDMAQDKVLPEVASLLMQHTITAAADKAVREAEERQAQGMQDAKDKLWDDQQKLNEENQESNQEVASRIAELQAGSLELKRKLGLLK